MPDQTWQVLAQACAQCQRCALADVRRRAVFGSGNPSAKLLVIGDVPSVADDGHGAPFVGETGRLVDNLLALAGLTRKDDVYLTTLVKCHPLHGRPPLHTEQEACIPHLRAQFEQLHPTLTICLGSLVAERILGKNFDFSTMRGQIVQKDGYDFLALHHPRDLLDHPELRPETYVHLRILDKYNFQSSRSCTE